MYAETLARHPYLTAKTMKHLPILTLASILLFAGSQNSNAQSSADSAAIRTTALDYIEGWYEGSSERMERALHPELAKRIVNTNPNESLTVSCKLSGAAAKSVSGRVLTGPAVDSHNTFAAPQVVKPAPFTGASLSGDTLTVALPPKSVVALEL